MKEIAGLKLGMNNSRGEMFLRQQIESKIDGLALKIKSPQSTVGTVNYQDRLRTHDLLRMEIFSLQKSNSLMIDSAGFKVLYKILVTGWGGPSVGDAKGYGQQFEVSDGWKNIQSNVSKNNINELDSPSSGKVDPFKVVPKKTEGW